MARSRMSGAAALLFAVAFAWPALACEGTEIVFEDKFADDAGGWAINKDVEVKDGGFTFKLPPDAMQSDLNVTYSVNDADICAEGVWPDDDSSILGAGLLFWGEDNKNYLQFGVLNNGKFWIARRIEGKWHTIVENVAVSAIREARRDERAQGEGERRQRDLLHQRREGARPSRSPRGGWRFGLSGDNFDKDKDARLVFRSVKVTNQASAVFAEQLRHLDREIAENGVGAGALARHQAFQDHALTVDPAALGGGNDHRVLAGGLIDEGRHVECVLHPAHDVEIRKPGLHHHHVGALGDVLADLAQRLLGVRRSIW